MGVKEVFKIQKKAFKKWFPYQTLNKNPLHLLLDFYEHSKLYHYCLYRHTISTTFKAGQLIKPYRFMWDTENFPRTDRHNERDMCAVLKSHKRCSARIAFLMWIASVYMCAIATARDFTIKHAMHAQISQISVNDTLRLNLVGGIYEKRNIQLGQFL